MISGILALRPRRTTRIFSQILPRVCGPGSSPVRRSGCFGSRGRRQINRGLDPADNSVFRLWDGASAKIAQRKCWQSSSLRAARFQCGLVCGPPATLMSLIRGRPNSFEVSYMAGMAYNMIFGLQTHVKISWVQSDSNWSDGISRDWFRDRRHSVPVYYGRSVEPAASYPRSYFFVLVKCVECWEFVGMPSFGLPLEAPRSRADLITSLAGGFPARKGQRSTAERRGAEEYQRSMSRQAILKRGKTSMRSAKSIAMSRFGVVKKPLFFPADTCSSVWLTGQHGGQQTAAGTLACPGGLSSFPSRPPRFGILGGVGPQPSPLHLSPRCSLLSSEE